MEFEKPFDGFAIKKSDDLEVIDFGGYETRNQSTIKLIQEAVEKFKIPNFDWIFVNTGDRPVDAEDFDCKVLSYSTDVKRYDLCCPDFVFDHWSQTGLLDYELERLRLLSLKATPASAKLGWRGAETHFSRSTLISKWGQSDFSDFELIVWDRSDPNHLKAKNFLSFDEQILKWRFLLDVEGVGYSGRLKLLLAANRCVFIQDRPYEEFFFFEMKPWVHYIPVKRDLSDLEEKWEFIISNPQVERDIIAEANQFSTKFLSRSAALEKWRDILLSQQGQVV